MGKLMGTVCACGMVFLPPRKRCVKCSTPTLPMEINDVGNVLTYTVLQVVPEGFEPPLILGLIQLDVEGNNENHLSFPKIVCVGKMAGNEICMDQKVTVEKCGEKYFFSLCAD